MKIKSLEWKRDYSWAAAQTEVGNYKLLAHHNGFSLDLVRGERYKNLGLSFKTEKEAKKAAQEDFEKRVKRCIEPG